MQWIWLLVLFASIATLIYQRASLNVLTLGLGVLLGLYSILGGHHSVAQLTILWGLFILAFIPLRIKVWRQTLIIKPALKFYRKVMPTMSRTEREALSAGTVSFEGELFCGNPHWDALLNMPAPSLSAEEQAFLQGPVNILCSMIDDWDITHRRADLPPEIWEYLKTEGFFALIIAKEYGGKDFSACAQSQILSRIYGKSASVATTVAVPNSLGPGELLQHYGTDEQKNHYLPRLASGEEIPCFALTSADAGSDAGSMTDTGIICRGIYQGQEIIGIKLNFNKRYITLAPVATVIGLAFRLYDPDQLVGQNKDLGITCALVPRLTTGVVVGRRHYPASAVFQNGPVSGQDVFVPLDCIIGGIKMAGQGWRMLMECLAAGRAISLPAASLGGAKVLAHASGAYARVRQQFNVPIGQFEGIREALARIAGLTWLMDATSLFTASLIDNGARPAIASAITKFHVTEMGRVVANDAMDLHGGKAVCLGPNNYLGRFYQSIPIAITVEGANILTRNLIIFGQGAMRCHPYLFAEFEAANNLDQSAGLQQFDRALTGHIGFTLSNVFRTLLLALTGGRISRAPRGKTKNYFQQITRFSSALALVSDVSLLVLGGSLKRREALSARLGDVLSYLYMLTATLKKHHDEGCCKDDLPAIKWVAATCLYEIEQRFSAIFANFPSRPISYLFRWLVFPFGMKFSPPSDKLRHQLAEMVTEFTPLRDHLINNLYLVDDGTNSAALLESAMKQTIAIQPLVKTLKLSERQKIISGATLTKKAQDAFAKNIISAEQLALIFHAESLRQKVIAVDDFSTEELMHQVITKEVVTT